MSFDLPFPRIDSFLWGPSGRAWLYLKFEFVLDVSTRSVLLQAWIWILWSKTPVNYFERTGILTRRRQIRSCTSIWSPKGLNKILALKMKWARNSPKVWEGSYLGRDPFLIRPRRGIYVSMMPRKIYLSTISNLDPKLYSIFLFPTLY